MAGYARAISLLLASAASAETGLHHVHLNAVDPAAAVKFYTSRFDCEQALYRGEPAVWAQKSWLLFHKVDAGPPRETDSAIWHIGWGAEDMPAEYRRQTAMGTPFHTPLTDISSLANSPGFFYAYVDGPDHALIELNTARHHHFGHLHLFSADPPAAARWYAKHFGIAPRMPRSTEPRFYRGLQVGPSASFTIGNVNVIIFPGRYRGHDRYQSTRGTVFDHIALSVDSLAAALHSLASGGVRPWQGTTMVEGPDKVAIEIIEGHEAKPVERAGRRPARRP
ncbi:MAG: hypothetical protein SFV51_05995 [Bryobacteraceae bacterium]|nr:hypothetical protein [Bryobacteraceae bacterium]